LLPYRFTTFFKKERLLPAKAEALINVIHFAPTWRKVLLSVHAVLNPVSEFLHLSQKHDGEHRKSEWGEEKRRNQSADALGGLSVKKDTECAQTHGNGDEIHNNSGYLNQFRRQPDENGQNGNHRCAENFQQYSHGQSLLFF
jgi:hypothetical protein